MIGATTPLLPLKRFEPPLRLRFEYFVDSTKTPRNIAEMPGKGPTWLNGFVSLPDAKGNSQLVATYSKIRPPMEEYERGLCKWNETEKRFERFKQLWSKSESQPNAPATPGGHVNVIQDATGESIILFGDPFPKIRCPATLQAWSDPSQWHELEPQREVPIRGQARSVVPHRGSIAWNSFRKCWVAVFTQLGGESSYIGELWYAEAEAPEGPWQDAVQVVTHHDYSFYNPIVHQEMTAEGSPVLLFEATFTKMFSGAKSATPRHNYNQVLYRLDLDKL